MPPAGLDNLKHIVVLMMENRSFDHMLGGLMKKYPKINGLTGNESNPDMNGTMVPVQPNAKFQGQLDHDPDHHFPGVDLQIFGGTPPGPGRVANMQGFIKSYATQGTGINASHAIMSYFPPERLPVLTRLATEYAVFNGWFSSIPGPTICNRAFAHYGTSFGNVDMNLFYIQDPIQSIYERMVQAGHTAKIYYYDQQSSTMEIVNLLKNQPRIFGSYSQFIGDCKGNTLPEYSFIEPCYNDHPGPGGGQILPRLVKRTVRVPRQIKREQQRRSTLTVLACACRPFLSRPISPGAPWCRARKIRTVAFSNTLAFPAR